VPSPARDEESRFGAGRDDLTPAYALPSLPYRA
jgi:hypothetical protein